MAILILTKKLFECSEKEISKLGHYREFMKFILEKYGVSRLTPTIYMLILIIGML